MREGPAQTSWDELLQLRPCATIPHLEAFSQIRVPIVFPTAAPNLEPCDDIWPTEAASRLSPPGGGGRVGAAALGISAGAAEGSADHQFPLRGATVPERALPRPGVALLRVHRREIAKVEVEIHQDGRGLVLLRGPLAPDARWGGGRLHDPDNRAGAPDVAPIHNRQVVVLDRSDWPAWLDLTRTESGCSVRCLPGA